RYGRFRAESGRAAGRRPGGRSGPGVRHPAFPRGAIPPGGGRDRRGLPGVVRGASSLSAQGAVPPGSRVRRAKGRPVRHRAVAALTSAIVLFAPFHEGGRDPIGLLVLHTLAILWVLCVCATGAPTPPRQPAPGGDPVRRFVLLCGAALLAVCASCLLAAYPLAACLGAWDIVVPCALFVAAVRRPGTEDDLIRLPLVVVSSPSAS